jgi:hypothetical protein
MTYDPKYLISGPRGHVMVGQDLEDPPTYSGFPLFVDIANSRVGVGVLSLNPDYRFQVDGEPCDPSAAGAIGSAVFQFNPRTSNAGLHIGFATTGTPNNAFWMQANDTTDFSLAPFPIALQPTGGTVSIGTLLPEMSGAGKLHIAGDAVRIDTRRTPTHGGALDAGYVGEICWDDDYLYICIAPDHWARAALTPLP